MYVSMHKHARLGESRGMLPQETFFFLKFDALRLLLRPFWDRSRIVVATWLANNIFGCPCAFAKPTREGTTVGRTAGG